MAPLCLVEAWLLAASLSRLGLGGLYEELKTSWPEVVGMEFFLAAKKIHGDRPDVQFMLHRVGGHVEPRGARLGVVSSG